MIYWEKQNNIKALYDHFTAPVRLKYGLTKIEYSVLQFLQRNPSCDTASSIVQAEKFAKSHVSSAVKKLEDRGLITAYYARNNNKTIHLKLTGKAEEIMKEPQHAGEKYVRCLFNGFTDLEAARLMNDFRRICRNAEAELHSMEEEKNA